MTTPALHPLASYKPKNKVRFITAASLFDGHDAAINIMRRILQGMGAEVIHLGHNRSVDDVVTAALQEDVQGIAISSYQGGHVEYFKYMVELLKARGVGHIKITGGGGGVNHLSAHTLQNAPHDIDGGIKRRKSIQTSDGRRCDVLHGARVCSDLLDI
jgi:methylmalonyl-CoA mutase cobalamin-binding domain/chain